jgi:cytochrome c oxidase cbb3-type subunit 3
MRLKNLFRFMVLPGIVFLLFGLSRVVAEGPSPQTFARDSAWNQTYSIGMTLYNEKCMVCHGEDGEGKLGLPLNLQSFLSIASIDYLTKSIAHGRPTRGMPEFSTMMSAEEINAVATYVKAWQYAPSKEVESGVVMGDPFNGKDWYRGICANCHGVRGEGGLQVGGGGHVIASFAAFSAPALADPGFQKSATDGFIKATLMYGRIGTPMASYLKGNQGAVELTEEEINDIVAFIRTMPPVKAMLPVK